MKLTGRQVSELRWLSRQIELVWGGVFERGGDYEVDELERAGLVERVAHSYRVGRLTFRGGYRITPAGRRALEERK
jgi:hypothetical protein